MMSTTPATLASTTCIIWYAFVVVIQIIGIVRIRTNHSTKNSSLAASSKLSDDDVPQITILRPVKGLDPWLYECLASMFQLDYPASKLTICICVSSRNDLAFPVLEQLLADFPEFDAKIYVQAEDDASLYAADLRKDMRGPNPKIRNMSRAYGKAQSDLIWIIDSNVWIGKGTAKRMVNTLCGYGANGTRIQQYRFVHQLPIVVDANENARRMPKTNLRAVSPWKTMESKTSPVSTLETMLGGVFRTKGGRLEEMFMASSHAKFYTAINTIAIAPCVVGKSNMFRRSDLNLSTAASSLSRPCGIDFFSHNICEDQLIGTMLWNKTLAVDQFGQRWGKHALIPGDLAIQPINEMSVGDYIARRVRWQRVRKYTTVIATIIEPGAESLLCSAIGAFAFTTIPAFQRYFDIPQTWPAFSGFWSISVLMWFTTDWYIYNMLHSCICVEVDSNTPDYALPPAGLRRRRFGEWITAWICRELLALPIWCIAVFGGSTVVWRSKRFRIRTDMTVQEIHH